MAARVRLRSIWERPIEDVDVLIVGAGISGVGCAYYLQQQHPQRSYAIVEARDSVGGTWDLFRYPGIRSDSDLQTFGYEFKPWESEYAIADGPEILRYIAEAVDENGIGDKIRFQHRVISAAWSSPEACWTVEMQRADTNSHAQIRAKWLFAGTGYFRYDAGYTPDSESGIRLVSGEELVADVVVTATGLRLLAFGGIEMSVDGEPVDFSKKIAFRGIMLDGIPNFAFLIGYTNASWTLKVGLVCEHFCRLLTHMDEVRADKCEVALPSPQMPTRPLLHLSSGYVQRALDSLPRQGTRSPWELAMSVYKDTKVLRKGPVTDRNIRFSRSADSAVAAPAAPG